MNLEVLLLCAVGLGIANLIATVALRRTCAGLDRRVHDIERRVIRLETQQEQALTSEDLREFYDRQANTEGQLRTAIDLLRAIQKHLLENEP